MHYLAEAPLVTTDEAYRAMLILADGEDTSETFAQRESKLIERGIANPAWSLQPDHVIDRGSAASMVLKICKIRGGVNLHLFGALGLADRRYAVRELVYRELLAEGPDYPPMIGGELVALITKADAYMAEHGVYETEWIELGTEEDALRDAAGE